VVAATAAVFDHVNGKFIRSTLKCISLDIKASISAAFAAANETIIR